MASSKLSPAASSSGDLPSDALYEILLRVPAKELCRLRAVCRSWRALTSDPLFVAVHKSRHTGLLLAMAYYCKEKEVNGISIVDLYGNVLRRIPSTEREIVLVDESGNVSGRLSSFENRIRVLEAHLDLIFFTRYFHPLGLWVLNPATGVTLTLPQCCSEELARELEGKDYIKFESCAFGKVSSTREYKVLRITRVGHQELGRQLCEVITFDGINHGSWRGMQGPPSLVWTSRDNGCVVMNEVVYFLMDFRSNHFRSGVMTVEPGSIASFNLETEEWMGILQGPLPVRRFVQDSEDCSYLEFSLQLSLAELNGCLVIVHNIHYVSMDLWFLTDFAKGIWVKKYNMPSQVAGPSVYPILVLDDGKILFRHGSRSLQSYDPRTGTYDVTLEVRDSRSISIYTGSLLSL